MRNRLQRRLAALAAAAIGAALLTPTAAGAQPAAEPAACPHFSSASRIGPQSCVPIPPPPPPPPIYCQLNIGDPYQVIQEKRIYVNAGISCSGGTPISITLIVELYSVESPVPVHRKIITVTGSRYATMTAFWSCHTGGWYGKVQASVQKTWSTGTSYGPLRGATEHINCVG